MEAHGGREGKCSPNSVRMFLPMRAAGHCGMARREGVKTRAKSANKARRL